MVQRFKKSRSEIVKNIFNVLLIGGVIAVAATSPYFLVNLLRSYRRWRKYQKRKISDAFSHLRREGYIEIERRNHQIYIFLTKKGKKKAGRFQIDNLEIKKPKNWDGQWRLILFDVLELKKIHREALRGKLKELGLHLLQKSVWIAPYDCRKEIDLLREFFGLSPNELRLVVSREIGPDEKLKQLFRV
jgi:DNA-binding transcriptional regulator PaaX